MSTENKPVDPYYRSSYAIKRELEPGLKTAMELLKLSLAEFLSMVAADPQKFAQLLGEHASQHRASKALAPRVDTAVREQRKQARELLKNADPETLARMLQAAVPVAKEPATQE